MRGPPAARDPGAQQSAPVSVGRASAVQRCSETACDSATQQQCDSATVRQCDSAMVLGLAWLCLVAAAAGKSVSKSGLQVEVTKAAQCKDSQKAESGDKVTVHYGGFLQDGENKSTI